MVSLNIQQQLFKPVDASSMVVFRIGFGVIMLWEVWRYGSSDWIYQHYIKPEFFFKYYGFEWISPWPGDGMYYHFVLLGILAVFITIGFFYRLSIFLFCVAFSYIFLLDQARYLNHFYMVILFALSLCMIPAHRYFSVDARLWPQKAGNTIPAWSVWLIRVQLEIVLLYAGIVKLNYDWLHLEPLSMWLAKRSDYPLIGHLFTQEWSVAFAAYGVIGLHLIGAPLLMWRKTRIYVFILYFSFHLLNHFVFNIGIFPWFTLLASLIFFDPAWPKQCRLKYLSWRQIKEKTSETQLDPLQLTPKYQQMGIISLLVIWLGYQIVMPLRHWIYPGNVSWTEEGHRFSWQMKLRDKQGQAQFFVVDQAKTQYWSVDPKQFLSGRQYRKMSTRPDMILQFAHYLRDTWAPDKGIHHPSVYTEVYSSLNGRKPVLLIDSKTDLAAEQRNLSHANWITALNEPFQSPTYR